MTQIIHSAIILSPSEATELKVPFENEAVSAFIQEEASRLTPDSWLLLEADLFQVWSILSELKTISSVDDDLWESLEHIRHIGRIDEFLESSSADFGFRHSRVIFDFGTKENATTGLAVLAFVDGEPFLACENDYDSIHGFVTPGAIARYDFFHDYTGGPISWQGGRVLSPINDEKAIDFGFGDLDFTPEVFDWHSSSKISDQELDFLEAFLEENHLGLVLLWQTTVPNPDLYSAEEIELFDYLVSNSNVSIELEISVEDKQRLIRRHLEKNSFTAQLRDMLSNRRNESLWNIFLFNALNGGLSDGGLMIESQLAEVTQGIEFFASHGLLAELRDLSGITDSLSFALKIENPEHFSDYFRFNDNFFLRDLFKVLASGSGSQSDLRQKVTELAQAIIQTKVLIQIEDSLPTLIEYARDDMNE